MAEQKKNVGSKFGSATSTLAELPWLASSLLLFRNPPTRDAWQEGREEEQRAIGGKFVQEFGREYAQTGNPLYAWRAYLECAGLDLPVPGWLRDYFVRVGEALWDKAIAGGGTLADPARFVAEALEITQNGKRGQGTAFSGVRRQGAQWGHALAVTAALQRGEKLDLAYDTAARERDVSRATIRRAWSKHRHSFGPVLNPPKPAQ